MLFVLYEKNEKKKDKDVTERITRILKQRDEALKGADVRESSVFIYILLVCDEFFFTAVRSGREIGRSFSKHLINSAVVSP